ncbi:hypothetical protein PRIPAC_79531 [Pristionchus pacificus]|uniref:Uncharacterized protein n=1 Tax=Pristionchus pacificus TaxID=54126 RepID=A0A2A6BVL1_PRIPA|nr:hypothetical protein PRIPAC_79531 [Pristionchus pacificus]|eukprot:PDM69960.1 hypothetical protein PRIPAC_49172 [Pristionchus pacificus]
MGTSLLELINGTPLSVSPSIKDLGVLMQSSLNLLLGHEGGSLLFGGLEASVAELGRCVDELEETLAGLARKLLGVPSGSHTLESLSAGNTDGVDHLVLGEDLVDEDLQTLLSPLDLVGDGPSVELDLHNVGLLVANPRYKRKPIAVGYFFGWSCPSFFNRNFSKRLFIRCRIPYSLYPDRIAQLSLPTIEHRRLISDILFLHKSIHGFYSYDRTNLFKLSPLARSLRRSHSLRIVLSYVLPKSHSNFVTRTIDRWNVLSAEFVHSSPSNFRSHILSLPSISFTSDSLLWL